MYNPVNEQIDHLRHQWKPEITETLQVRGRAFWSEEF